MLSVRDVTKRYGKLIANNQVSFDINPQEISVLLGPNGAGKSTLANVIMGDPRYQTGEGSIYFEEEEITEEKPNARARRGMFLSFQMPEEIEGITLERKMCGVF